MRTAALGSGTALALQLPAGHLCSLEDGSLPACWGHRKTVSVMNSSGVALRKQHAAGCLQTARCDCSRDP